MVRGTKMKKRKDWCKLPYTVILDERLSSSAKIIYAVLLDISNDWRVVRTIKSIAELTGVSPRQVLRALEQLREAGYIVSKHTNGRSLTIEIKPIEIAGVSGKSKGKPGEEQKRTQSRATESDADAPEHDANQLKFATDEDSTQSCRKSPEEDFEESLKKALAEKLPGKSQTYVDKKYREMKAEATRRVKNKTNTLGYLSKMITNMEVQKSKSYGFNAEDYECLINNFGPESDADDDDSDGFHAEDYEWLINNF